MATTVTSKRWNNIAVNNLFCDTNDGVKWNDRRIEQPYYTI